MQAHSSETLDVTLKLWAVAGPLLTAGISTWWARRNQVNDRDFIKSSENEQQILKKAEKAEEQRQQLNREKYTELKMAIATFMGATYEYVRRQTDLHNDPKHGTLEAAANANDKFIYSCQLVVVLGDESLADAALLLWDASLKIPRPVAEANSPQHQEDMKNYRLARTNFNKIAREHLISLEAASHA